jgi:hypothetical protein
MVLTRFAERKARVSFSTYLLLLVLIMKREKRMGGNKRVDDICSSHSIISTIDAQISFREPPSFLWFFFGFYGLIFPPLCFFIRRRFRSSRRRRLSVDWMVRRQNEFECTFHWANKGMKHFHAALTMQNSLFFFISSPLIYILYSIHRLDSPRIVNSKGRNLIWRRRFLESRADDGAWHLTYGNI